MTTLVDLIEHRSAVAADATLGEAFHAFTQHTHAFMAVVDGNRLAGLCARNDLGMLLGSQYGFSLFEHKPLTAHLRPDPLLLLADTDLHTAFGQVFARDGETFYDDVLVIGRGGALLGLVPTQTLVRLQNRFHRESIRLLQEKGTELALKNQQIEADLRLSRELQQALLPARYPCFPPQAAPEHSLFRFQHVYRSVGIVGGDFCHVQPVAERVAGICIADVMGHGVRAALVTSMLRALLEELGPLAGSPSRLLTQLNRELASILGGASHDVVYATALYLTVDADAGTAVLATAGHPPPIRICRQTGQVERLRDDRAGTLLGFFDDFACGETRAPFLPGDTLVLFTDGIVDVESTAGEAFGVERLCAALAAGMQRSTPELLEQLLRNAADFADGKAFTDDVCLIAVDRTC